MSDRRRDRAGDKIRGEAYRLAFEERLGAAEIETRLIAAGLNGVPEALDGIRVMLDAAATAPRREGGVLGLFRKP